MNTSIVLCNMQLDDTRPNLTSKIRQYLSCKDWQKNVDVCFTEHKYMVDLTAIMNANETFGTYKYIYSNVIYINCRFEFQLKCVYGASI